MTRSHEETYHALRTVINLPPLTIPREGALIALRTEAKEILGLPSDMRMPDGVLADTLRRKLFSSDSNINITEGEVDVNTLRELFGEDFDKLFEICK